MKGMIVYKSNYGATKQYAQWLSEETGYKCMDVNKCKTGDITDSDTIIIGCPVFARKPVLTGWINKKWKLLKNKKLVLFTTSGADPETVDMGSIFSGTFDGEMQNHMEFFPLGGRIVFNELNSMHRFMMKLGSAMEKDPEIKKEMLRDKDHINRAGLKPLIDFVS